MKRLIATATLTASIALLASAAFALTPPASTTTNDARPDEVDSSVTLPTPTGTETIRSGMPAQPAAGPAPAFSTLDTHHRGYLDPTDAAAYPLLGTDFIYADANRDGKVSKAEYEKWVKRP